VDDPQSDSWTTYRSHGRKRCAEYALVLRSVGIGCEVRPLDGGFELVVAPRDAERAREQLALYRHENPPRPARFEPRRKVADGLICASLYGTAILIVDVLQDHQAFSFDWLEAGKAQAELIRQGEWWRTVTALSLHADSVHLAGNLVFGLVFGFLAGQLLGWGLAWSAMLLAGALGNALNAFLQAPGHTSVGASTAVFAAVGILAFYAWRRRESPVNRWVPLGGGIALLAFLGMGGERTDIAAHLTGFASGGLLGALFASLNHRLAVLVRHQTALGLAALALLAAAWSAALLARG
jgi:membrane associated rhomboid family serine protease